MQKSQGITMIKRTFFVIQFLCLFIFCISFADANKPLSKVAIYVDMGHDIYDPGASGLETSEFDYNFVRGYFLGSRLAELGADIEFSDLAPHNRIARINKWAKETKDKKLVVVSIHHNSTGGTGSETYYGSEKDSLKIKGKEKPTRIRM